MFERRSDEKMKDEYKNLQMQFVLFVITVIGKKVVNARMISSQLTCKIDGKY